MSSHPIASFPGQGESANVTHVGFLSDRFRYVSALGAGAMGSVCLADDTELHRRVAIKTVKKELSQNPDFRKRIERECLLHAKVGAHPHIVTLFDKFEVDGQIHLVMEYVEGRCLQDLLERNLEAQIATPVKDALKIGIQCLDALSRIHAHGVVHRDIKPSNIMITHDEGGEVCAKLMDFGVARLTTDEEELTRLTTTDSGGPGTPLFMAPEQIDSKTFGEISALTDVYAMGILLFQLFSGTPPFRGTLTEVLNAHVNIPAPRLDASTPGKVPRAIGDVLQRALAKRPRDRFPSAIAFRDALCQAGAAMPSTQDKTMRSSRSPQSEAPTVASSPRKPLDQRTVISGTTAIRIFIRRKRNLMVLAGGVALFLVLAAGTMSWLVSALRGLPVGSEKGTVEVTAPVGRQVTPPSGMLIPEGVNASRLASQANVFAPRAHGIEPAPQWYIALARMDWMDDWNTVVSAPEFDTGKMMPSATALAPEEVSSEQESPVQAAALNTVPQESVPSAELSVGRSGEEYVVEPGDTLSGIAARYELSSRDLQWWNGITNPRALTVGQTLLLYPTDELPPREEFFAQVDTTASETPLAPLASASESGPGDTAGEKGGEQRRGGIKGFFRRLRGKN